MSTTSFRSAVATTILTVFTSSAFAAGTCSHALLPSWRQRTTAAGLRELMHFARRGAMRETARLIDVRRGTWSTPPFSSHGAVGRTDTFTITMDMGAVIRATRTRGPLILAHTHPSIGAVRFATALKVDFETTRAFVTLLNALPSYADFLGDERLRAHGFRGEQWVVSSKAVVAFAIDPSVPGAVTMYRNMMAALREEIRRVKPGDEPMPLKDLIDLINGHPDRPVRLRLIQRV